MNLVETALVARLAGTAALTALLAAPPSGMTASIFNTEAPSGAQYPYVVLWLADDRDDTRSPHRAKSLLYGVKAVSTVSFQQAGLIDEQIDTALHGKPLTVAGWSNYWAMRESGLKFIEDGPGGRRYYHRGGIYRLRIAQ